MHADLDGFKGAETKIGEEFGRGRCSQIEAGLPFFSILFPHQVRVEVLEILITSIFDGTLDRVAEEGGAPTSEDSSNALSSPNRPPSLEVALVELGIDLASAFDEI